MIDLFSIIYYILYIVYYIYYQLPIYLYICLLGHRSCLYTYWIEKNVRQWNRHTHIYIYT